MLRANIFVLIVKDYIQLFYMSFDDIFMVISVNICNIEWLESHLAVEHDDATTLGP